MLPGDLCQDVSTVGNMARLAHRARSSSWAHIATAVVALHPEYVLIENVLGLLAASRSVRGQCPTQPRARKPRQCNHSRGGTKPVGPRRGDFDGLPPGHLAEIERHPTKALRCHAGHRESATAAKGVRLPTHLSSL
ncbi:hypothetical protein GCM10022288_10330 [Gryllotalpicola kribbensis]|uniref:DNA (cytosine-5-)-methyltransferase n=1 Tax=Gryllotalpicola kribbensis TaxID=993084 RepID=A0ABP8AMR7_9MICO